MLFLFFSEAHGLNRSLSAAIQRQAFLSDYQVKVPAVAGRAFPAFIFRGAPRNRHSKLILALLAFIIPGVVFKDVLTCAERRPGRGFHDIRIAARWAMYIHDRGCIIRYRKIE